MDTVVDLRDRAARWRHAAETTRTELAALMAMSEISWRAPSAEEFRRVVSVRVRELRELAECEDSVARLLDRLATEAERVA